MVDIVSICIYARSMQLTITMFRYRYQLEAFIDKLKGREPKVWITAEDSINQMKAVEMVYNKVRLFSQFVV